MAKIKTAELSGAALDWAVAKCEGVNEEAFHLYYEPTEPADYDSHGYPEFHYSTVWAQAGPILDRERITIRQWTNMPSIHAYMPHDGAPWGAGPTPLIAAMRCFCCSKLGREIEVPDELL